jgi:DNA mismatch repair protein MutS
MDYPHEIYVKDYFEIHNYYSNIYGKNRTIILIQVGSFHEAYCTDDEGLNLIDLSQKLDICCTKKNNSLEISKKNPRMMGFPIFVTNNFIDKLIDLNYTIVLINQVSEPPNPKRKVVGIYSPATYIDKKTNKPLYLLSIVLDKIKNGNQLCIGLSAYDLSTGHGYVHETYSTNNDILLGLDDTLRFIESYPPKEILLLNNLSSKDVFSNMDTENILKYLNIDINDVYHIKLNKYSKIQYQRLLLNKIYNIETNIDIIEYMGLHFINWARLSLVILLDYVISHQPILLEKIKIPIIFQSNKYLYLGNRALEQLDVFNNNELCLLKVVNFTKTFIGKRFLINQLSMPLLDTNEINIRYNLIEKILINKYETDIVNYLEDIYDLDKLIRKLEINIINPYELYQIYISFYQINKLVNYLNDKNMLLDFDINNELIENTNELILWIENMFILNKISDLNNFNDINTTIYNNNIHNDIDELQNKIDLSENFMSYLIKELEKYIDDKIYFKRKKEEDKNLITLKYNDRDGHYLLMTNRRCDILKKSLKDIKEIKIGTYNLKISDLEFNELPKSSNTKINCIKIKEISLNLVNLKQNMNKLLKNTFKNDMKYFLELYSNVLHKWTKLISYIDFINSGALCANNNHFTKPIINEKEFSYFNAKLLRHPIVEKINNNTEYIPHDIQLGSETEQNGILLYGINSSGKSTLMKSIGLNIILAQIGYYVASKHFEYSPYNSLFTRINGNDNIFRGMSSFMIEMMELMSILKRNNNKTLIIGDEICRGTEEKSANIIVCYMLETLSKSNSSFITATHLHNITTFETIKKLTNIKIKHLKITYDSVNDLLIYDRCLSDGQGDTFYGLQVAKYLMKDTYFNERTLELLNEYDNMSLNKISNYNNNVILDKCEICNSLKNLETHHIIWQKDFINGINKNKFHLQKNNSSNLVVLCRKCHDDVDNNKIIINGWKETSKGKIFDYQYVENKKKRKYSNEIINYINSFKNNNNYKMVIIKIKEKFNKKISSKTITKVWNNEY